MSEEKIDKASGENQKDSPEQERLKQMAKAESEWKALSDEEKFKSLHERTNWSHLNIQRLISYVETVEKWRTMPFYPTDADGNAIDKDGNKIDPATGKQLDKGNPGPKK